MLSRLRPREQSDPRHLRHDAEGEGLMKPNDTTDGIKFHILPVNSTNLRDTLGSIQVDKETVRKKLDEFLRNVIESRLRDLDLNASIAKQMDRRVEVASKTVFKVFERELIATARDEMQKRLHTIMASMPISVAITIGEPSP